MSEDTALGDSHEVDRNLITARVVETTRKQGRTQQKLYTRKPEPLIPLR